MLRRAELQLLRIARRKRLSILLSALAPLVLRALLLAWHPAPVPRVHDEFSHLLVADTFAHGRVVNSVHPLWVFFESMHIVVRPVYASVYPVAQGAVMAAGQVLTGVPWTGVWLSMGLMCATLCWMLQGWVSPGWALAGAALAVARFGVFSYWMNSHYGGAVAAAGGALVLGALPRILRRGRWQDAVVMAAGIVILANSRPYEGAVFCLPVLAVLLWKAPRSVLPMIPVLAVAALAIGWYNARFSGNPLQLPYTYYRNTATMAPHFIWQSPRPAPVYHHRVLWQFHTGWEMKAYTDARANRPPYGVLDKAKEYWRFYLGPFLTIPFVTLPWMWKRRRTRFLLLTGLLVALSLSVEVWHAPHYAAPALGLVLLLAVEALRQCGARTHACRAETHLGARQFTRFLIPAILLATALTPVVGGVRLIGDAGERARIQKQLESTGERHLVVVRYTLAHNPGDEWVYNSADIDNAPVVWAREMDPGSNQKLLSYFHGRRVWLAQPDIAPVVLTPYDPAEPPDPPFRFVPLGTDAIEAVRDPQEVRRKVLARAADGLLTCDHWNFLFTSATGVAAPDAAHGCFAAGDRARPIDFNSWFAWLARQR